MAKDTKEKSGGKGEVKSTARKAGGKPDAKKTGGKPDARKADGKPDARSGQAGEEPRGETRRRSGRTRPVAAKGLRAPD